jgi:hypothetical protein
VLATCHDTFRHNVDTTATGLFSAGRHDLVWGKIHNRVPLIHAVVTLELEALR